MRSNCLSMNLNINRVEALKKLKVRWTQVQSERSAYLKRWRIERVSNAKKALEAAKREIAQEASEKEPNDWDSSYKRLSNSLEQLRQAIAILEIASDETVSTKGLPALGTLL